MSLTPEKRAEYRRRVLIRLEEVEKIDPEFVGGLKKNGFPYSSHGVLV